MSAFDHEAIRAHVEMRHKLAVAAEMDGVLTVTVIELNLAGGKDNVRTLQFAIGDVEAEFNAILGYEGRAHINLYAPMCIFRRDLGHGKKGSEKEVVCCLACVADMDNDTGKAGAMPLEAPYVIETSPGNTQHFLPMARPLIYDDAKRLAMSLGDAVGCDPRSKDVSGIWRIPGTLNYPNKKKLERGRPREPQPVKVLQPWTGELIAPETLAEAIGSNKPNGGAKENGHAGVVAGGDQQLAFLSLPAGLKKLITAHPEPDEDRSSVAASVICSLIGKGWDDAKIAAVIRAHPQGIGARYAEGKDLDADIQRLRSKASASNLRAWGGGASNGVSIHDFHAYMPMHNYIYAPSRDTWPASSVNSRIPPMPLLDAHGQPILKDNGEPKTIRANIWLDQNRSVEQMTWAPGQPIIIEDRLISDGGWIEHKGIKCFNLYRPPTIELGDATKAGPWLEHVRKIFGDDAQHIIRWLAHRVQHPQDKINHALVLGGCQGIGKDTLLEPVKSAVGPWNFSEVSPQHMLGRFNGYVKSVILRVSEARDLGDIDRFGFYDHLKTYTAAPPDVLRVDEKNIREYSILNCCGVIITTNHKTDGIYLPPDDRRHFVAWSDLTKEDFPDGYWTSLANGLAYGDGFKCWLQDRKNRRMIPHRMEQCGYAPVRNVGAKDGLWKIEGTRQVVYAKKSLSARDRSTAARKLVGW